MRPGLFALHSKPLNELSNADLVDLLFEPVTAYICEQMDLDGYLHSNKEQYEWDLGRLFYNKRSSWADELKRRIT